MVFLIVPQFHTCVATGHPFHTCVAIPLHTSVYLHLCAWQQQDAEWYESCYSRESLVTGSDVRVLSFLTYCQLTLPPSLPPSSFVLLTGV